MDRFALITGATGGIGKAISVQLANDGFNLLLIARSLDKLETVSDTLKITFPEKTIKIIACDVSQPNQVAELFEDLYKHQIKISVLINGAGISGGGITPNITNELWLNVINTNLNGMFFVTKELLRLNLMPSGGRIINIASTGGKQGVIHGAPYSASKHGMIGFTKSLGLELARNNSGITVNAVCPGFVETEMAERVRHHYSNIWKTTLEETKKRIEERVPLGRYIDPNEVASMVSYIASQNASGITAQAFNVCGGLGNY